MSGFLLSKSASRQVERKAPESRRLGRRLIGFFFSNKYRRLNSLIVYAEWNASLFVGRANFVCYYTSQSTSKILVLTHDFNLHLSPLCLCSKCHDFCTKSSCRVQVGSFVASLHPNSFLLCRSRCRFEAGDLFRVLRWLRGSAPSSLSAGSKLSKGGLTKREGQRGREDGQTV